MKEINLNIAEEVALLAVNEDGDLHPKLKSPKYDIIIASAILMDLALQHRIDTDMHNVIPDKLEPLNDPILDVVIEDIKEYGSVRSITEWISDLSLKGQFFREEILKSVVDSGILKVEEKKVLWMFSKRIYPMVDDKEVKEVRVRIRDLVFSDDIPDPKDIVIISLFKHTNLMELLFTNSELKDYDYRIAQIAKMDMIGLAIADSLDEFKLSDIKEFLSGEEKSPEEMLDNHVNELKEKFRITNDANLPAWLRKGTSQFAKTLDFVRKHNTADITFNHRSGEYQKNNYSFIGHGFGSGS
ncbi:MAG: GPP34 family phosphoprotein [Bacteroidales bacterium]|nr:GPP34 family phosphoprotein [Bacteroidales bacterium]